MRVLARGGAGGQAAAMTETATFAAIDLSRLPAPSIIETLDYETIYAEMRARVIALIPEFEGRLESDPAVRVLQVCAWYRLIDRQHVNDRARGMLIAFAQGGDLDHLGALMGVTRLELAPADAEAGTAAEMEEDEAFRRRIVLAPESFSVAGPSGAYIARALAADGDVLDASASSPSPACVTVYILSRAGDGLSSPELLAIVAAALSAEDVRPIGDRLTVETAAIIPYAIEAGLVFLPGPDAALVMDEAMARAVAYAEAQHRIGRAPTRSGIFAALHIAGVANVQLTSPADDIPVDDGSAAWCTGIALEALSAEGTAGPPLAPLTLDTPALAEGAAPGTLVSLILGMESGATLRLLGAAGGRFALDLSAPATPRLIAGDVATDYETARAHNVAIEQEHGARRRVTTLTVAVTNIFEAAPLADPVFADWPALLPVGTALAGDIGGLPLAARISARGAPAGLIIDDLARRWTWSGLDESAGESGTIIVTTLLDDSPNSPLETLLSWAVSEGGTVPLPALILTPADASIPADMPAGAIIATIGNVPAGATPALTAADPRLVISASAPWRLLRGLGAVSEGATIAYAIAAAGATGAAGSVLVTAPSVTPTPTPTPTPSTGLTLIAAPSIAQTATHLTLASAGEYSGDAVTGRSYILYRNGVHIGAVTLPYAKAPEDAQTLLSVREVATAGALTGTGMSNSLTGSGERPALVNLDFSAFPNGTKLRDIPGIVMTGDSSRWDGAVVAGGKMLLPAYPADANAYGFMIETGPGNIDVAWSWIPGHANHPWDMSWRWQSAANRFGCYIEGGASGLVTLNAYLSGSNINNVRTRLPISGGSPWVENDVLRVRTQGGRIHFYQNGTSKLITTSGAPAGESPNDASDAGFDLGGALAYLQQWGNVQIPANRWLPTQIKMLTIRPVDVPMTLDIADFTVQEEARTLAISAKVTVPAPAGYALRIEAADGTAIIADADITLVNVSGALTGSISIPEAMLVAHQGQTVTVMLRVKGDAYSCASRGAMLVNLATASAVPLHLGMNGDHAGTWGSVIIERDLATRARWVWNDSGTQRDYPHALIDLNRNFPTAYPPGGSDMQCIILENGVHELGQYEITLPSGMTGSLGSNNLNASITPFIGGKATVTFTGTSSTRTWLWLRLTGTIPANARITVLPKDDPYPTRSYHQQLRDTMENGRYTFYRYMTPLHTNNNGAEFSKYFQTDRGLNSGFCGCRIGTAIDLARDTGTEIWWNFYHLCSAAYEDAIADAVAHPSTGIPMGQIFHCEYSNEEWNGRMPGSTNNMVRGWLAGYDRAETLADAVARPLTIFGWDMDDIAWNNSTRIAGQDRITTMAVPNGAYFFSSISGYGVCIYRAKQAVPIGTLLPFSGGAPGTDAYVEAVASYAELVLARRRYTLARGKALREKLRAKFIAAGRSADDVILHCNYQNAGGAAGAAQFRADCAWAGVTPGATAQVSIAPYYTPDALTSYSGPLGADVPMDRYIDGAFDVHLASLEGFAAAMKTWRTAAQAAGAADAVASIYEVNQHIDTMMAPAVPGGATEAEKAAAKALGQGREAVWKQDARAGILLKAFLERAGQLSPDAIVALFDDVSPKMSPGWGLYNSQGETAAPTNPGGIAVHEWVAACLDKRTTFDIFARTTPQAGTQTVRIVRTGPTTKAQTVQLTLAPGASNGIAAGEVTGGFGNRAVSFAAGQIWQDVTISTSNSALRTLHLSLTGLPGTAQIGALSAGGFTQAVRAS